MKSFHSYITHSQGSMFTPYEYIDLNSQDTLEELGEELMASIMDGMVDD